MSDVKESTAEGALKAFERITSHFNPYGSHSLAAPSGSASDYNPAECLRKEVERFKATNRFTPMDVTGFYIQAAVVLDEHRRMVEALREIRDTGYNNNSHQLMKNIAARALLISETARTPNEKS